jgi:hypothetical protein
MSSDTVWPCVLQQWSSRRMKSSPLWMPHLQCIRKCFYFKSTYRPECYLQQRIHLSFFPKCMRKKGGRTPIFPRIRLQRISKYSLIFRRIYRDRRIPHSLSLVYYLFQLTDFHWVDQAASPFFTMSTLAILLFLDYFISGKT